MKLASIPPLPKNKNSVIDQSQCMLYDTYFLKILYNVHRYTCYSAHSLRSFSVSDYIKHLSYQLFIYLTINPNPLCQLSLWKETGEPGEIRCSMCDQMLNTGVKPTVLRQLRVSLYLGTYKVPVSYNGLQQTGREHWVFLLDFINLMHCYGLCSCYSAIVAFADLPGTVT